MYIRLYEKDHLGTCHAIAILGRQCAKNCKHPHHHHIRPIETGHQYW